MTSNGNPWDDHAEAYARRIARHEPPSLADDTILARMLELMGTLDDHDVLDAGCGEGFLSRVLAARGARVTGIDLSPRLIDLARTKESDQAIRFHVADLSGKLPEFDGHFDIIGSYLVLNDVADYRGFATTLAALAKPGGRIVLAFNNPYSSVVRDHISDYYATGTLCTYQGLTTQGVPARYYHRTLEEYLDAFLDARLQLVKLADAPDRFGLDWLLPKTSRFPRFMILAFGKPSSDHVI